MTKKSAKVSFGDALVSSVREAVNDAFKGQVRDLREAVDEIYNSMKMEANHIALCIMESADFWDQIESAVREQIKPTCELNFWKGTPAFSIWFGEDHPFVADGSKIEIAYEDFLAAKKFTDSDRLSAERQLTGVLSLISELRLAKVALETRLRSPSAPPL